MENFEALSNAVVDGDAQAVESEVKRAVDRGDDPSDILDLGLIRPMGVVGDRMASGDAFIPEVLMSAQAMHSGLEILRPLLERANRRSGGRVVIGTVQGDIHDIGKQLVKLMLEGNGFEVYDLGVDVKADAFVKAVQEHKPEILAMSALLTTTMPNMRHVIESLARSGLRDNVKIIVGGASVNQQFADAIGADGYAPEAGSAVEWARQTMAQEGVRLNEYR